MRLPAVSKASLPNLVCAIVVVSASSGPVPGDHEDEHDCSKELSKWKTSFSDAKKQFCCESASKGCEGAEPDPCGSQASQDGKYDCEADLCHWKSAWASKKKSWCCQHETKGCAGGGEPACTVGAMSVTEGKVPENYDCVSGYPDYVPKWSQEKREYCCSTAYVGCVGDSKHEVSEAQKEQPGKPPQENNSALPPYDCSAGFPEHVEAWSSDKQDYCCKNSGRACHGVEASSQAPDPAVYDCQKGYPKYVDKWSADKKAQCCERHNMGCPTSTSAPPEEPQAEHAPVFDCDKGFPEHVDGWSADKKAQG
jgi:hypothetical protein